jgi:hypothetical protein
MPQEEHEMKCVGLYTETLGIFQTKFLQKKIWSPSDRQLQPNNHNSKSKYRMHHL